MVHVPSRVLRPQTPNRQRGSVVIMPKTTIEVFRKTADECQRRADLSSDRVIKAELLELATQWHWLARQVAELCERTEAVPLA
jgi:hypothetical protein